MKKYVLFSCTLLFIVFFICSAPEANKEPIRLSILYDNYSVKPDLKAEWGFACLIEGKDQTVLFDTGRTQAIFDHNVTQMKAQLSRVDQVVISHNHSDHKGNLFNFLKAHADVTVYLPASFPKPFSDRVEQTGARLILAEKPVQISKTLYLTGDMPGNISNEQALILKTDKGLVVIVGCAHPGVAAIVRKAKQIVNQDVYLVIGGFHLLDSSPEHIRKEIEQLKKIGVQNVGPTHCTGDMAIRMFKDAFKDHFVPMGVGKVITLSETQ